MFRKRSHPTEPNLRQVHLIHAELLPGDLGENITTRGIDLLNLHEGTLLRIGPDAVVQVTGLRNPRRQIDRFQAGLLKTVLPRDSSGKVVRKTGITGIVLSRGRVNVDNEIRTEVSAGSQRRLASESWRRTRWPRTSRIVVMMPVSINLASVCARRKDRNPPACPGASGPVGPSPGTY
ncbi:hypothetical protein NNX28_02250 [Arthrobacter sp. zg-Y859]|uniref:MOSC domain-containing protein n=1 Tax=Arthrobacter jinronghuae TaxID=2964609 RepID=A0ABT1NM27_9MICC|nr:MOSC domain-containing protein [Arthrobacter jinronghuae]MCQ1948751.1 hypothetical protein [Arthrobacter jinronghuae]UWX78436.1 hypothetical protein N2K98_16015 [Arthrobacter jinronghuae]